MKIEKVMIVDDDDDVRAISELAARKIGNWAVVSVASGAEAVALAPMERPDVILLDVMMPPPDGPATLAMLRDDRATATIPVKLMATEMGNDLVQVFLQRIRIPVSIRIEKAFGITAHQKI